MSRVLILLSFSCLSFFGFAQSNDHYNIEIETWQAKRLSDLKAPTGWINLAGLFWLEEGRNTFGSDSSNKLVFNHPYFPSLAGTFKRTGYSVEWISADEVVATDSKGVPILKKEIFNPDSSNNPTLVLGQFRFTIIKREDKIGVRFRDTRSPALNYYNEIPRFAPDLQWKITASFEPSYGKKIPITNVLGQTTLQPSPGKLVFNWQGKQYKLDAIDEGGNELFIIFGDATSGVDTYPAGRFMYVNKPTAAGVVIVDFNKAFNPPCAFSDFATCPLPPKQNILPFAVNAGEKTVRPYKASH